MKGGTAKIDGFYNLIPYNALMTGGMNVRRLSNFDIEKLLRNVNNFSGVFSRDALPKQIGKDSSGVINLDAKGGPGTHWVGFVNAPWLKYVVYFDSFGLAPSEEVVRFLKTSGKEIYYNSGQLQDINSELCGVYVVDFIRRLNQHKDLYKVLYSWKLTGNEPAARRKYIEMMSELEK